MNYNNATLHIAFNCPNRIFMQESPRHETLAFVTLPPRIEDEGSNHTYHLSLTYHLGLTYHPPLAILNFVPSLFITTFEIHFSLDTPFLRALSTPEHPEFGPQSAERQDPGRGEGIESSFGIASKRTWCEIPDG